MTQKNHELFTVFGARLDKLMSRRDYTNESLAKKLGVSRQTVYNWTSGRAVPSFETLIKLVKTLNSSLDYLMRGIQTIAPKSQYHETIPFTVLPVYSDLDVNAADGSLLGRNPIDKYIYPGELPPSYFLYSVPRDNMQCPEHWKSINKGDLLLIHPYRKVRHGDIVAVLFDDYSPEVYQFFMREEDAIFTSYNDKYLPYVSHPSLVRAMATAVEVIPRSRKLV